ncbi:MAG: HypC/HybG/HupF family hydrogenase formation chaperone [Actinomycetota bacterium]|nr:HypC/HybG/HupF family hydrogenase formation chaperone [Actinomycetota bacterium]
MSAEEACSLTEGCITCGDIALPLTVLSFEGMDALCQDDDGRPEIVATELVGPLAIGDRILVHAGVAIERLDKPQHQPTGSRR